ncbi:MAG: hypothetical protein ACJ77G_04500 [Solirubrobacteraceae bacterium]
MGVVGPEGQAVAQQVAGDVQAAVGAVLARVLAERLLDAGRVEWLAGDHPTARPLIGGDVHVHVGPAAHGAVGVGPGERAADGAGLRVVGARGRREGERRKGAGDGARTEDPEHRAVR